VTFAIVPACGHSLRMGRPKLSLPLGNRTVIEHVVGGLLEGGVSRVLVVVGPHVPELIPLATGAGADVLAHPEPTIDMRATVQLGLTRIEELARPEPGDWWLLAPADHPALSAAVIHQLLVAAFEATSCSVIVPVHVGRRGHPVMLRWRHARGIRLLNPGEGINMYLRSLESETHEVPITDPGILADLDSPEDYQQYKKDFLG
jgi:molybdenum cofactor cytidylyltransferase